MSGHSHAANIMMRKGTQDRMKAKVFSKLAKEITVAVKIGGSADPAGNSRLKLAIANARKESMPKDNIERAVSKGITGGDSANYEDVRYEGYGPSNVAVIVEALTDSRNRTSSAVRSLFAKAGGAMGETGSVAYNFTREGVVFYKKEAAAPDAMFEAAVDAGADDAASDDEGHEIVCAPTELAKVRDALEARFGPAESVRLEWRPNVTVQIRNADDARKFFNFMEALQDNDDVQKVWANHEISDEIAAQAE